VGEAVPQSPSSSRFTWSLAALPVWLVGVLAALVAAAAAEVLTLAARAAGVPMAAAGVWESAAQPIPVGGIARSVVIWSIGGILLAVALARWARRPARTFVLTAVGFTVLTLVAPVLAVDTAVSTQVVLVLTHVVAAAVVVPVLARRLTAPDAGR
jgi:hypothetical protein